MARQKRSAATTQTAAAPSAQTLAAPSPQQQARDAVASSILDTYQKNFAALSAAALNLSQRATAVFERQQEILRTALEQTATAASERVAAAAPQQCPIAIERFKLALETGLANIRQITELAEQSKRDAFDAIQRRMVERLQERATPTPVMKRCCTRATGGGPSARRQHLTNRRAGAGARESLAGFWGRANPFSVRQVLRQENGMLSRNEMWGTFAVDDHLRPRPFVAEILLFDRLVIPQPHKDDDEQYREWIDAGWRPDKLIKILDKLQPHKLAFPVTWDKELRSKLQSKYG